MSIPIDTLVTCLTLIEAAEDAIQEHMVLCSDPIHQDDLERVRSAWHDVKDAIDSELVPALENTHIGCPLCGALVELNGPNTVCPQCGYPERS